MSNAKSVIASLDAKSLRERLAEIDAERKALMVLLRAAENKDRAKRATNVK